ncbi:hypothetical protein CEUSTIGMA_g5316.t1 [Chlamydomonas eustigma]|uniref:AMMECR1 domain-containing protein n=1 Tax=Chlamydomonas eustigma TaxID=1157962 RepID=A0A250X467_9CHLO|nr:hypothetical protein CEUSTIGMA_g5316.t1 [Chlamydomonas eustigma]|eukprot:GAX77874.1 hypothetical protein CEUSTIGMA_g5316.t1 [Chlamydomonas eustigma]
MRKYSKSTSLEIATTSHVIFAFDTLISHLKQALDKPSPEFPDAETALFVTWKRSPQQEGEHAKLRGCIGILEPRNLHSCLRDYTLTSALRDTRFPPIHIDEIPDLECTVSLLSCFEPASGGWHDWEVGVHGIIIEFEDPDHSNAGCKRSATFLPEVAQEQGWSKMECIDALIRKSGYRNMPTAALRSSLTLIRYQSTNCTLTYAQYFQLRASTNQWSESSAQEMARETTGVA